MSELTDICIALEHYETPVWAINAILDVEPLTESAIDPCAGTGIMATEAHKRGYFVHTNDIREWGFSLDKVSDFLQWQKQDYSNTTFFMNPPFSMAVQFVEKCFELNAGKIICFQRFAWWESQARRSFWEKYPPARVYICGDRASCWRHDMPVNKRGKRYNPENGKEMAESSTAHAWFIWERGQPPGTLLSHIYKKNN